jgi:predicted acetyltransferase
MDYISEWELSGDTIVPMAASRNGLSYSELLEKWASDKTDIVYEKGFVPSTLYFLVDESENIYGALHLRHELNDHLLMTGGHIGYGIRKSQRRKGYAGEMLSLSFPLVKEHNINKVLITCDKENTGSAKTIIKNGGVFENEILEDGEITQRYWINL